MQKAKAGQGKIMDKMVRKRKVTCVRHLRLLHKVRVVRGAVLMLMERKKKR
jgi:hypothetical protein